jgi:hypothetical protein
MRRPVSGDGSMSLTTEGHIPEQRRMLDVDLYLSYVSLRHVYLRLFLPIFCGLRIHFADPCIIRLREDRRAKSSKETTVVRRASLPKQIWEKIRGRTYGNFNSEKKQIGLHKSDYASPQGSLPLSSSIHMTPSPHMPS